MQSIIHAWQSLLNIFFDRTLVAIIKGPKFITKRRKFRARALQRALANFTQLFAQSGEANRAANFGTAKGDVQNLTWKVTENVRGKM